MFISTTLNSYQLVELISYETDEHKLACIYVDMHAPIYMGRIRYGRMLMCMHSSVCVCVACR